MLLIISALVIVVSVVIVTPQYVNAASNNEHREYIWTPKIESIKRPVRSVSLNDE